MSRYHELAGSRGTAAVPVSGLLWVAEGEEATQHNNTAPLIFLFVPGLLLSHTCSAQRATTAGGPHAPRMTMQRLTCDST
jgi:hypothetical protein